jgi:hypothetical protein
MFILLICRRVVIYIRLDYIGSARWNIPRRCKGSWSVLLPSKWVVSGRNKK